MRPPGTAAELERRRRHAVALLARGESPALVARVLGVARPTLYRWRANARSGPDGLAAKPHLGPATRLTAAQLRRLDQLLRQGAGAHGWPNRLWTAARVARLITVHFGVHYHPDHVRKVLQQRLGWSPQTPRRRAREQRPEEVARWRAGLP